MGTSSAAFNWIRELVAERAGNVLDDQKTYLVETRLRPLVESEGLDSVDALVHRLKSEPNRALQRRCVEALLIHESSFFRDPHYFDALADNVLPELLECRQPARRLTIWCAACATGQEAFSLAMLLHERFPELLSDWELDFVASDLSQTAIQQATDGTYSQVEMDRGLSPERTARFFQSTDDRWKPTDLLRQTIRFQEVNLLKDSIPVIGIDLVLIRNVLIYMNDPTRQMILARIRNNIAPHGHVMLGATETLFDIDTGFERAPGAVPTYRPAR